MTQQNISAIFASLGYLLILLSGACMMVGFISGARRLAGRLFLLGIFSAIVASVGAQWLAHSVNG